MTYARTLDAWRASRDPELVQALVAEAALVARAHPAAAERVADEIGFHELWMRTAKYADPADTPWLAETLLRKLGLEALGRVGIGGELPARRWRERAAALAAHGPNPLVSLAGLKVLRGGSLRFRDDVPGASADDLYGPAFALVRAGGHLAIAEDLAGIAARHRDEASWNPRGQWLAGAIDAFIVAERPTSAPTNARSPAEGAEESFRRAIVEDVDDDAARLVFADWLTERGDPLGEFIVLQCALAHAPNDAKTKAKAGSLLRKYKDLWLGDVRQVLQNVEFERGFLAGCSLAQNAAAIREDWARFAESPVLRTIVDLAPGRANKVLYSMFVRSPALVNLRVLHHVGNAETRAVADGPPRAIRRLVVSKMPAPKLLAEVFSAPGLPELRVLALAARDHWRSGIDELLGPLHAYVAKRPIANLRELELDLYLSEDAEVAIVRDLLSLPIERAAVDFPALRMTLTATRPSTASPWSLVVSCREAPPARFRPLVLTTFVAQVEGPIEVRLGEGMDDAEAQLAPIFPRATFHR